MIDMLILTASNPIAILGLIYVIIVVGLMLFFTYYHLIRYPNGKLKDVKRNIEEYNGNKEITTEQQNQGGDVADNR